MSVWTAYSAPTACCSTSSSALWLVQEIDAPRVLLAWMFGTNTAMAVFRRWPRRGRRRRTPPLRARSPRRLLRALLPIVLVTDDTVGIVTIALVWIGHTVTGSELFQSAGMWALVSERPTPTGWGRYQGVSGLGYTLGDVWAPPYTFLAMNWGARAGS